MATLKTKITKKQRELLLQVIREPLTDEEHRRVGSRKYHSAREPHWSESIRDWPSSRWDPVSNAPVTGAILTFTARDSKGKVTYQVHYAEDLSGDHQPPFKGFYNENLEPVNDVVEWQPSFAQFN